MRKRAAPRPREGCLGTCLTRLMLALIGAGIIAIILLGIKLSQDKVITLDFSPERAIYGAPLVLPAEANRPGGLLLITREEGQPDYFLTYLNRPGLDERWTSPSLGEDGAAITVAAGEAGVYVAYGHHLLALDESDGDRQWDTELPDGIAATCLDCLQVAGRALVALTEDGKLQSFDLNTGIPLWQDQLDGTPQRLMLIGDRPAIIDTLPDGTSGVLKLFDPASGRVVRQITPRCTAEHGDATLTPFSPVVYDPSGQTITVLFGGVWRTCARHMDASGGQVLWESSVETAQIGLPRSWLDANSPLLAGKVVTYAAEKTDGDRAVSSLIGLDLSGGALRQIVQSEDCTLTPLAVQDAILIAHAACTRGAAGDELWGIDPASGEIGWRYLLHDANESWAAHPATGGFMVIQIFAAPDRIVVELLDPATGNRLVETAQTVPSGVWSGTAWTAGTAWLAIHDLVEIDLTTGEARIVWP